MRQQPRTNLPVFHVLRPISIFMAFVLFLVQSSCSNANEVLLTSVPTPTNTVIPVTNTDTPMPTNTTLPSLTPSPTPEITGAWSEEQPMLIPRSAHAVTSSDSAIYALAGTDDQGRPVLEVESFDGNQSINCRI